MPGSTASGRNITPPTRQKARAECRRADDITERRAKFRRLTGGRLKGTVKYSPLQSSTPCGPASLNPRRNVGIAKIGVVAFGMMVPVLTSLPFAVADNSTVHHGGSAHVADVGGQGAVDRLLSQIDEKLLQRGMEPLNAISSKFSD